MHLRGLTGADELSVEANNTSGVLALLRSLSQNGNNGNRFDAAAIVTADRGQGDSPAIPDTLWCKDFEYARMQGLWTKI